MANDQRVLALVIELSSRSAPLQHRIAEMLQNAFQFVPFDVGGWWRGAQLLQGFAMLCHVRLAEKELYCN